MKKTFNAPEIVELDFKDTSSLSCGVDGRRVQRVSGDPKLLSYGACFSVMNFMGSENSFDNDAEQFFDFDENED